MATDPRPDKRLGQHFLRDRRAIGKILDSLDPKPQEALLEIGPGAGALTLPLLGRTRTLAVVEIDPRWATRLRERHEETGRPIVYEENVLNLDFEEVRRALAREDCTGPLKLVGNLPYSISKPMVGKAIAERGHLERCVFMLQSEVTDRLLARPGSRSYGPLGILAGEFFRIERILDLGPEAFRPRPKVRSSVTRWFPRTDPPSAAREASLRACLRCSFAHRRQTLRNNLRGPLGGAKRASELLEEAGIDPGARAESLTPDEFRRLSRLWDAL